MQGRKYGKPLIGLAGGIGSGKSFVAQALARDGCGVVNSDALAHEVLGQPEVARQLVQWWGAAVLDAQGLPDRRKIAQRVFEGPEASAQLNGLIHPRVAVLRERRSAELAKDERMHAIVWDTPLLFENGLETECDAIIFVKAPYDKRLDRVAGARGWSAAEMAKRENFQISLDKKEKIADYVVDNSGEEATTLHEVHQVLSQILSGQTLRKPHSG